MADNGRPLPSPALFGTADITQIAATLVAIYGIFMTPVGWTLALAVWAYALAFFVINDLVKVRLFRIIHPYT